MNLSCNANTAVFTNLYLQPHALILGSFGFEDWTTSECVCVCVCVSECVCGYYPSMLIISNFIKSTWLTEKSIMVLFLFWNDQNDFGCCKLCLGLLIWVGIIMPPFGLSVCKDCRHAVWTPIDIFTWNASEENSVWVVWLCPWWIARSLVFVVLFANVDLIC